MFYVNGKRFFHEAVFEDTKNGKKLQKTLNLLQIKENSNVENPVENVDNYS